MPDLDDLTALKKRTESLRREVDLAQGELTGALKRLQEEFECHTLEEGEALLEKLKKEEEEAKKKFSTAFTKFEEKWGKQVQ